MGGNVGLQNSTEQHNGDFIANEITCTIKMEYFCYITSIAVPEILQPRAFIH